MSTLRKIDLAWHTVTTAAEIEMMLAKDLLKEVHAKKERHALFLSMKHPNERFYRAAWGPELLHISTTQDPYNFKMGRVYCSFDRYGDIIRWIQKQMFPA